MPDLPAEKLHQHPKKRRPSHSEKKRPPVVKPPREDAPKDGDAGGIDEGARARIAAGPYAELHCLSNFSFLRGASHPEELVASAGELGYAALAITDRNSLAGVVRAHLAVKQWNEAHPGAPLQLVIGAEITPIDAPPLVLLAPDRSAYGRLCRLITRGRLRCRKGECAIRIADLAELCPGSGWIGLVYEETQVACDQAPSENAAALAIYKRMFTPDHLFLSATLSYDGQDEPRLTRLAEISRRAGIPLVATNRAHYHVPERRYLQDVLTCIREHCTLAEAGSRLLSNAERHLRPREEIHRRYRRPADDAVRAQCVEAVARSVQIAQRCIFRLEELRYEYPHELAPEGKTAREYLEELVWRGAGEMYGNRSGVPGNVVALLNAELQLIADLKYEHYFLTVWDLVRFARSRGILCQGRGSAANSAVCFCLGVTAVDPTRHDLLFERFLSRERNEPPDIDVDFEHERREEVFQYIYSKYGRERAAITAEVITYRPRLAVRDVGKALGLSLDRVDALAKSLDWFEHESVPEQALQSAGLNAHDRTVQMLLRLVRQLLGFPRHLSQHVGGFVITESPLCEIVPLENGAMPDRTFIEWDKDDIDALGILKVDCLALGMLTAISKCFQLLKGWRSEQARISIGGEAASDGETNQHTVQSRGDDAHAGEPCFPASSCRLSPVVPCSLLEIPPEDPIVYDMICAADTVGVFQIESRAQMSMLPRLRPRNFYDLVIEVAIVRPGPIQGGMVHPYLRRRDGLEPITYPSDAVRGVLHKTLGVPLFQEQVMRLAMVAAGFTPGEADQLRRAMAAWRRSGQMEKFEAKLVGGMRSNGYTLEFAEQIYRQIQGFGEYGFPESHAASFALLVYASSWLKCYFPAAFCAAMQNSQPLGFYSPGQLIRDAIQHGVDILPIDVNYSEWDCTLESNARTREGAKRHEEKLAYEREDKTRFGKAGAALRLGMRLVRGLSEEKVRGVAAARADALLAHPGGPGGAHSPSLPSPIASIRQLARQPDVSRDTLLRLAAADAFRSLGLTRRQALWHILALDDGDAPLFSTLAPQEDPIALPHIPIDETVVEDYGATGFSLNAHPIGLVRGELDAMGRRHGGGSEPETKGADSQVRRHSGTKGLLSTPILRSAELRQARAGQRAAVAGLVTVRQRPGTARGTVFMTIEDETGMANLVIRPQVWERNWRIARRKLAFIAEGRVERQGEVVHVMVARMHDLGEKLRELSKMLPQLAHRSRDFH